MQVDEQRELNERLARWRGWEPLIYQCMPMVWIHQNGCTTPSFDPCNNVTQALELLEWYCTTYSEAGWNVFTTDIGCLWLGYFVRITEDTGEMHEACEASLPFAICKALDAALGGKADA